MNSKKNKLILSTLYRYIINDVFTYSCNVHLRVLKLKSINFKIKNLFLL